MKDTPLVGDIKIKASSWRAILARIRTLKKKIAFKTAEYDRIMKHVMKTFFRIRLGK